MIAELLEFCKNTFQFTEEPKIVFRENDENAKNPIGNTGYYDPAQKKVVVFISERHIKDVMRSLAHELVHHSQNCQGRLNVKPTNEGYAQTDSYLRSIEEEAYSKGNLAFRDWTDGLKAQGENK